MVDIKSCLEKLLPRLQHEDEMYIGDHWATGSCPRCLAEIALGFRNPTVGGLTIFENQRLAQAEARRPPPPETLVDALQDRIPIKETGTGRAAKSVKFRKAPDSCDGEIFSLWGSLQLQQGLEEFLSKNEFHPSRELDQWIAEVVFGWKRWSFDTLLEGFPGNRAWILVSPKNELGYQNDHYYNGYRPALVDELPFSDSLRYVPKYSSDANEALAALEFERVGNVCISKFETESRLWRVNLETTGYGVSKSVSTAICVAILSSRLEFLSRK